MPVCEVCEGDRFDVLNGLYFCRVCNTQSQEIIEEEVEYAQSDASSHRVVHERKRKSKHKVDQGKPWYTVEGFQVVLKVQVDTLIKLGCTPKLSEVVQQIWLKYVHTNGLACIDPSIPQGTQYLKSFRDEYLSGIFGELHEDDELLPTIKTAIVKLRLSSRRRKSNPRKPEDCVSESSFTGNASEERSETMSNPDVTTCEEEWFSLESNFETSESESDLPPAKWKRYKRPDRRKNNYSNNLARKGRLHMGFLNHKKLIAILFIGLQWCKELVTLGDLITWIKQGHLPFLDSVKLLLPHMKLGDMDMNSFHLKYLPTYTTTTYTCEKLIKSLSMPTMPDVNIIQLLTRYVVQLNLPHAFVPFVKLLIPKFNYTRNNIYGLQHYVPDLVAFGLVIIAMKLLYGLDDEREWDMEDSDPHCKHHSGTCESSHTCNPFVWRHWSEYQRRRRGDARRDPAHCFLTRDSMEIEDVHSHQEHWNNVVFVPGLSGKDRPGKSWSSRELREQMKTKCWVFEKICDEQGSSEEMERRRTVRSYPYVMEKAPPGDDMSLCCLCGAVDKFTSDEDTPYVWYNTCYTRPENCFERVDPASKYRYSDDTTRVKEVTFHASYELMIRLCVEFTCASWVAIQEAIQDLEKAVVCPYLRIKQIT